MAKGPTYLIRHQFAVGTNVKETASSIIGASTKGISIREVLDGVDVGIVSAKGLETLDGPNVP